MKEVVCYFTIYENNAANAKRIYASKGLPVLCVAAGTEQVEETVTKLCNHGIRVFIARGGIASVLKKVVDVPVLSIHYDFMDFYRSVNEAFKISNKVAMIGWYDHLACFKDYLRLLPEQLKYYPLPHFMEPDYEEMVSAIRKSKEDGIEVVVGGAGVVPEAIKLGMKAVLVDVTEQAFLAAAEEAFREAYIQEEKRLRYVQMEAIFQNVSEGLIFSDLNGKILHFNERASALLPGLKEASFLAETGLDSSLVADIQKGVRFTNFVMAPGMRKLVLNVSFMRSRNEVSGILLAIQEASYIQSSETSLRRDIVNRGHFAKYTFGDITGSSRTIQKVKEMAALYAKSSGTVLILGETGAGKELFAQSIHNASARKNEPFVALNCATLPESILESELFGYVKGAFTGARNEGKEGIFETANKGTIFLDEIGEISQGLQARLLRVLQEKEIVRVGDRRVIPVDVRVIAATNRNLLEAVKQKTFRQDLYYRLCVLVLGIPPLRQRKEDIVPIASHLLLKNYHIQYRWTPWEEALLTSYDWPGNVRELSNFVERLMALCPEGESLSSVMECAMHPQEGMEAGTAEPEEEKEEMIVLKTLRECGGNREATAKRLGISRATLWRRLRELKAAGKIGDI